MIATNRMPRLKPETYFTQLPHESAISQPISEATKWRNTALDWLFYDVGSLSQPELDSLVGETNLEGSILVVYPKAERGEIGVRKFENYTKLRAAPGRLLSRFSIAGVGSSDVGAAAFARNLADHYGEPVGAIVAGYGLADVLAEAMGGWFFLGASNRFMKLFHDRYAEAQTVLQRYEGTMKGLDRTKAAELASSVTGSLDSQTLLRLLLDRDREIKTLLGHSKGCLSLAYALQALAVGSDEAALQKAKTIRIVTTGTVVELPNGFDNASQFLGSLDWFGGMNSRLNKDYERVMSAWHHVNTAIPFHISVNNVLRRADSLEILRQNREQPAASKMKMVSEKS